MFNLLTPGWSPCTSSLKSSVLSPRRRYPLRYFRPSWCQVEYSIYTSCFTLILTLLPTLFITRSLAICTKAHLSPLVKLYVLVLDVHVNFGSFSRSFLGFMLALDLSLFRLRYRDLAHLFASVLREYTRPASCYCHCSLSLNSSGRFYFTSAPLLKTVHS